MIVIREIHFGYWPNEQHTWLMEKDECSEMMFILQQLYAQMLELDEVKG